MSHGRRNGNFIEGQGTMSLEDTIHSTSTYIFFAYNATRRSITKNQKYLVVLLLFNSINQSKPQSFFICMKKTVYFILRVSLRGCTMKPKRNSKYYHFYGNFSLSVFCCFYHTTTILLTLPHSYIWLKTIRFVCSMLIANEI